VPCFEPPFCFEFDAKFVIHQKCYVFGMKLESYWLIRPEFNVEPFAAELELCLAEALKTGVVPKLPVPTWAFLIWLNQSRKYLMHGTGDPNITIFEPRQSNDVGWFGNQKAVYAASDGIWAMFFAILNRPTVPMSISNSAVRLETIPAQDIYFFSVTDTALEQGAFHQGWVYILPRDGFEQEPSQVRDGVKAQTHHWASLQAVKPLFRVAVDADDFPFLHQIRAHNDEILWQRIERNRNGFPWLED
jgi:hypothetical protein